MSQYIAEEQNLLANFQQDNKFERLLSSYSQVTIKFKPNLKKKNLINYFLKFKKFLKTNFLKTKLLSSSLRTVVVKTCLFSDTFRLSVSP